MHLCFYSLNEDGEKLASVITERTSGAASPDIVQAVAHGIKDAIQWMKTQGVKFIKGGSEGWRENTLAPPIVLKPGLHWEGRGGDVMLRTLTASFKAKGGTLMLGTRATKLDMQNGRCAGVHVEREGCTEIIPANNVVLCGGFQANLELLRKHITPAPEKLKQRGAATGNGDGMHMAREAGARVTDLDRFYGHLLAREAMENPKLWPYPMIDHLAIAGIVVNSAGERFMDEGLGGVYMANCIAKLDDPWSTAVIFDEAIWDGPARAFILPANPNLVTAGATILRGESLQELAGKLGVPAEKLQATVDAYNAAVKSGAIGSLQPARSSTAHEPLLLAKPPYYSIRLCPGITFTMGGIATDGNGRVMNEAGAPIPGLFAAGCTTGGLEGGPTAVYVGGLSKGAAMGFRIANHIAADVK